MAPAVLEPGGSVTYRRQCFYRGSVSYRGSGVLVFVGRVFDTWELEEHRFLLTL